MTRKRILGILIPMLIKRFIALFLLLLFVVSPTGQAEQKEGDVGELSAEAPLYDTPDPMTNVMGKLPMGTVFTFMGEQRNGLSRIRVELENGEEVEGWVPEKLIRKKKEYLKEEEEKKTAYGKRLRKGAVPKDEVALLRREPSFEYGILLGGNYGILSHTGADGTYSGMGFTGGGYVGFYLDRDITLRAEAGYSNYAGAGADGNLSFGLVDLGAAVEYSIDRFLLFGGLRYEMGIGIGNIPRSVPLGDASELSSSWADFGAGYRMRINEMTAIAFRGKYGFSFVRVPVAFQVFSFLAYLEIRG